MTEKLFLYFFYACLVAIQIIGFLYSQKKKQPKIRWKVFIVSMLIYYLPILIFYFYTIMQKIDTMGFRELGLFLLMLFGLVMPITQIGINIYKKIFYKN
jgi:hypothetical protein